MLPKIFKGGTLLKTESGQKVPPPSTTSFQSPAQIGLIKFMYYNPSRIISNNNSKKLRFCTSLTDWLISMMLSIANKIYEIISIIHFIVFPQTLNYIFAWYWIRGIFNYLNILWNISPLCLNTVCHNIKLLLLNWQCHRIKPLPQNWHCHNIDHFIRREILLSWLSILELLRGTRTPINSILFGRTVEAIANFNSSRTFTKTVANLVCMITITILEIISNT